MKAIPFLILIMATTGCGQQISDFVTSGAKRPVDIPSVSTSNPNGHKISPGANELEGTNIKSRVAITPTRRTAIGSQVKSTFTFHQNRPE